MFQNLKLRQNAKHLINLILNVNIIVTFNDNMKVYENEQQEMFLSFNDEEKIINKLKNLYIRIKKNRKCC